MKDRRARKALWKEIRRIAEADLTLVAQEIRELESDTEGDAYYRAVGLHARAESQLVVAATLAELRHVAGLAAEARHQIACARAGEELTPRPLCLFDPAHGPSARQVVFARTGGALESVPACSACAEEVDAGRAPPSRKVIVAGRPQPYYRSPAHVGYYGSGDETLSDLLAFDLSTATLADLGLGLFDLADWLDLGV